MSSITFKAVVISSNRRKDGTYPVKIRVTYKGVSRRLPTNLVAYPADLTRSLHIKSPSLLNKAQPLIVQMQEAVSGLSPFTIESWDVDRVVAHIRNEMTADTFRLDFFEYAEKVLAKKHGSTRRPYDSALNSLADYLGRRELDINDITKRLLLGWRESIEKSNKITYTKGRRVQTDKPHGGGNATRHLDKIAHIYNAAKFEYNDDDRELIPRSPFAGIPRVVPPSQGQHNLGAETMQKIIDAAGNTFGMERVALSVFVLSFLTMGANLADLWEAQGVGPVWVYNRKKTKSRRQDRAEMRVTIPPEAGRFIQALGGKSRGVWLPALHSVSKNIDGCTHKVNGWLKSWAKREGLEPFTFYAARHTWASLARKAGVEKATIDECLCHVGEYRVADIYIEKDYELLDAANRKVLALLNWPRTT